MGKIFFGQYVNLMSFNLSKDTIGTIKPPTTESNTKNSVLYSQVSNQHYNNENNTLSAIYKAGNLASDQYAIYRLSPNDLQMTYLGTLNNISNGVTDYGVASNKQYKYIIQTNPESNSNITIQTNYLNIHWNKWSIVSLSYDLQNDVYVPDNTVFLFDNNINVGSVSDNLNIVKYNTLGRFGKVMQNKQQYDSGSFSCLFGGFQTVYNITDTKNLIIDKTAQNDIFNSVVVEIKNFVDRAKNAVDPSKEILLESTGLGLKESQNRVLRAETSSSIYSLYTQFYGNNLTINIYTNGNIELLWTDNVNHTVYRGVAHNNTYESSYNLVSNMPEDYQRKVYCDVSFVDDSYRDSYLFFDKYKEYYYYAGQWYAVKKHFAYYDNDEKMLLWKKFVADQRVKLLKSPKGDMWVVAISDQTSKDVNYNTTSYPTTISFNWQEVIDKDKISIVGW